MEDNDTKIKTNTLSDTSLEAFKKALQHAKTIETDIRWKLAKAQAEAEILRTNLENIHDINEEGGSDSQNGIRYYVLTALEAVPCDHCKRFKCLCDKNKPIS